LMWRAWLVAADARNGPMDSVVGASTGAARSALISGGQRSSTPGPVRSGSGGGHCGCRLDERCPRGRGRENVSRWPARLSGSSSGSGRLKRPAA